MEGTKRKEITHTTKNKKPFMKQLTEKQKKLDVDNDGVIEASDFKALRGGPKMSSKRFKGNGINAISAACKRAAKNKFKVWPSAYASGWGVQCTKAGGPSKFGGSKKKK
jgi:hypothetical protein